MHFSNFALKMLYEGEDLISGSSLFHSHRQ